MTKAAENPPGKYIPFGAAHTHIAHIRDHIAHVRDYLPPGSDLFGFKV